MRLCAGSTAKKPAVAIRQIARGGPYGAGWRRSHVRRGCASADGNRARGLVAGYSAGRSVCPWSRHSPRCVRHRLWQCLRPPTRHNWVKTLLVCGSIGVVLLLAGAVPKQNIGGSQPYRRLAGDCLRVLTSLRWVKPGLSQGTHLDAVGEQTMSRRLRQAIGSVTRGNRRKPIGLQHNGWQPDRKLLASGSAVSPV